MSKDFTDLTYAHVDMNIMFSYLRNHRKFKVSDSNCSLDFNVFQKILTENPINKNKQKTNN